ncbi:ABC transporter ATP-binding protein, partial [Rhizobium ruizarguesonis]
VGFMYNGQLVEIGDAEKVCRTPEHAYTQSLISAIPRPDPRDRDQSRRFRYVAPDILKNGSSLR